MSKELTELLQRTAINKPQEEALIMVTAAEEIIRLNRWIADMQAGCYINCVYCGHRYGPDDGNHLVTMQDALRAHIEVCPKHPMSALKLDNEKLVGRIELLEGIQSTLWKSLTAEKRMELNALWKDEPPEVELPGDRQELLEIVFRNFESDLKNGITSPAAPMIEGFRGALQMLLFSIWKDVGIWGDARQKRMARIGRSIYRSIELK